ncbi:hypothetical protein [Mucilaginibacter sp.]|uniref:hypothetical protein n=1 Tax=Mucilaginibacter sp. TaxID=1882438 RepID=UPI003265FAB8
MKTPKITLSIIFLILPLLASAHGEEALLTGFIYVVSVIVFFISLIFINLPGKSKGLLALSYFGAFVVTVIIVNSMPFMDHMALINLISVFLPAAVVACVYHRLKPAS